MVAASSDVASEAATRNEMAAALWTQETGMVSLQDLLVSDYGLGEALEGWWLE